MFTALNPTDPTLANPRRWFSTPVFNIVGPNQVRRRCRRETVRSCVFSRVFDRCGSWITFRAWLPIVVSILIKG
jgi:hypothetical protein